MAQTLGQFIEECELFEYSNEYYSMIKECNEITLMEKYLENQEFISNIPAASTFTEGYLMEAASEETTANVKKSLGEKAKGLLERVTNFFKNIIPKIIAALTKFRNMFDSTTRDINAIYAYFKKNGVSKEAVSKIMAIFGDDHHKEIDHMPNQPFNISKLKIDYSELSEWFDGGEKNFNELLAFSLSDTKVVISESWPLYMKHKKDSTIGPVPVKVISKICKELTNRRNKSYDYSGAIITLEKAYEDVKKNGMEIIVNSKDIDKIINELQNMVADLSAIKSATEYRKAADVSDSTGEASADHTAKEYDIIIDGINKINSSVASTLALYTAYINYRKAFINSMKPFLGLDKQAKKTDNDTTPDTDEE